MPQNLADQHRRLRARLATATVGERTFSLEVGRQRRELGPFFDG